MVIEDIWFGLFCCIDEWFVFVGEYDYFEGEEVIYFVEGRME